ncbi:MAG TPA: response regulator [Bryobacteraceae bacterium]|nr:response regulator [Bryobacteraceae bacterium]
MIEILLVEDNPGDALLVKESFSGRYVARVTVATDGEEALGVLFQPDYRPDLILLDLSVPKLNGHQLLKRIRRKIAATVPIVILSASGNPDDIASTYANGANAYVEKPTDPDQLLRAIQAVGRLWIEPLCRPFA